MRAFWRRRALLFLVTTVILFNGCGYRVGNIAGKELQGVRSVYVPVVKNESYEPGLQVMTTNAILRRFDNDGTLQTTDASRADAELYVTIKDVKRDSVRSSRDNLLVTAKYRVTIVAEVTFLNRRLGKKTISNATVSGSTEYFVQSDLQEGERQALPLAADDLARQIVQMITEGW